MSNEQMKILLRIKELVRKGKRRFAQRKDRSYKEDLYDIGITQEEAWKHVLFLNENMYFPDLKPNHYKNDAALVFKEIINGKRVYIKLKIENDMSVCLSFHIDSRELR